MTITRIHWTTSQETKVCESMARILVAEHPLQDWRKTVGDQVPIKQVRHHLPAAQLALDKDFHRSYWTDKHCAQLGQEVMRMLRIKQLDSEKRVAIADSIPTEALIEELAKRLTQHVCQQVLLSIRTDVLEEVRLVTTELVAAEISRVKQVLRHSPISMASAAGILNGDVKVAEKELPTYAVVGLLPKQANIVEAKYKGIANIVPVLTGEYNKIGSNCKNRIAFCMRHIDHASWIKAKASATEAIMVNGHVTDLTTMIDRKIAEFSRLDNVNV